MKKAAVVWFREDLRLRDNPALSIASMDKREVIPVFIWNPQEDHPWERGSASKVWLHHSLEKLAESLKKKGLTLIIRKGSSLKVLKSIAKETGAEAVFWNRCYEPKQIKRDKQIQKQLTAMGLQVDSFSAKLLFEPWDVLNKEGEPYQVFTPFWKAEQKLIKKFEPLPIPNLHGYGKKIKSDSLTDLKLLPKIKWYKDFPWTAGEDAAWKRVKAFIKVDISSYEKKRDFPAERASSILSPYLAFGEISARQIWHEVTENHARNAEPFLRQLAWRDFAHSLLYFFPTTPEKSLKKSFHVFPWKKNQTMLKKWQKGHTGYPIVDAGMRQLWKTGWMHNRVRMIVASFLVKDLMIPWQMGSKWFWDTLVDADLANNTLGWQWVAGCGADAAPYFRIFNPVTQGEKFDSEGAFIRRYVPELAALPDKWIHKPWLAPPEVLKKAKVELGKTYPYPIVQHEEARKKALELYQKWKKYA